MSVLRHSIIAGSVLLCAPAFSATESSSREWRFAVSLDDKPIGYHHFGLRSDGNERRLTSEARFNVKVLFVEAYSYQHVNRERWRGNCLAELHANTIDNGEHKVVRGSQGSAGFVVNIGTQELALEPCVMTFAYWNPDILRAQRLLNPQTGEYVAVTTTRVSNETIRIRGTPYNAERFRLIGRTQDGERMQIDLWYSAQQEWLALESLTDDGRRLRYQPQ
jgi:hypothetical protein